MQIVMLQPTMDTLRDFHSAPPWMNFPQCYHLTIKSTINSSKKISAESFFAAATNDFLAFSAGEAETPFFKD